MNCLRDEENEYIPLANSLDFTTMAQSQDDNLPIQIFLFGPGGKPTAAIDVAHEANRDGFEIIDLH